MLQNSGNILMISPEPHELTSFRAGFVDSYNVFTASTIREGHQILKDYDIHVILVRQHMPEMTALQFCESISGDFPETIKIILNKSQDIASLERAAQTGLIYRFVQVPYQQVELRMTVDGALKLSEAEFKNRELDRELAKYRTEHEHIIRLFKRYVPGEVVSQALQAEGDQLMRPGETRIVSVLFADIRGFTKFTSRLRPQQVVEFLNDYWKIISECIRKHKGSVNKYMGDGMLAIFGAPVSHMDNHSNAVSAALEMLKALRDVNAMYSQLLGTEIKIGIGINTGEVIVGNIGTEDYMEYTVIGDTVNIASRLETISKKKPNSIMISKHTYELVKHAFETSELMQASVEGKENDISYCEVLGKKPDNIINISSRQNR